MGNGKIDILVDELKEYLNPNFYTKGVSAIERLIIAVREEKTTQTMYVCDRKSCGDECENPECHYTYDVKHAKNFHEEIDGVYAEYYEEKQYG